MQGKRQLRPPRETFSRSQAALRAPMANRRGEAKPLLIRRKAPANKKNQNKKNSGYAENRNTQAVCVMAGWHFGGCPLFIKVGTLSRLARKASGYCV